MLSKTQVFIGLVIYLVHYIKVGPVHITNKRLDGKTVLITGADGRIGKATALEFAKLKAKVVIASRNVQKSQKAKDDIIEESGNENVHVMMLDLGDISSIKSFAEKFDEQEENLHYLINNAGVFGVRTLNDHGFNQIVEINFFGQFLLTHLLMDKMKKQSKTSPVRIINVSSAMRVLGAFAFEMFHQDFGSWYMNFISISKMLNIYFTIELNKRLKGFDITTYAVQEGAMKTELEVNNKFSWLLNILHQLFSLFLREPFYEAQTTLYCALDDNVTKDSGKFFGELTQYEAIYLNEAVGQKIWEETEKKAKKYLLQSSVKNLVYDFLKFVFQ